MSAALVDSLWREIWQPPDRRPIYEWAGENVFLPLQSFPKRSGFFRCDDTRSVMPIFEALQNDAVREVVVYKAVSYGGTMIADVWLPWTVANDPGNFLFILPTKELADGHADMRTMPILEHCPPVAKLFPKDEDQKRRRDVLWNHGAALFVQGAALRLLQAKRVRYLFGDEAWNWEPGRLQEAIARTQAHQDQGVSKVLICSQGGEVMDELDERWQEGTQNIWTVPCLNCDKFFALRWEGFRPDGSRWGMRYDQNERTRDARGRWNLSEVLPTVRYECPHCGQANIQNERLEQHWNLRGKDVAENPRANPAYQSFRRPAMIFRDWKELVTEWLKANDAWKKGIPDPRREFIQKQLAEPWSEERAQLGQSGRLVAYDVNAKWDETYAIFLTVDVQEDHFWFVVRAWSKNGKSRRLDFGKLFSWTEIELKQEQWKSKGKVSVICDCRFRIKDVYFFCRKNNFWTAALGEKRKSFSIPLTKYGRKVGHKEQSYLEDPNSGDPERGTTMQGRMYCNRVFWSNPTTFEVLRRLRDGRGEEWLCPTGGDPEKEADYNRQLHSTYKRRERSKKTGRWEEVWFQSTNDHLWDCECMQVIGAKMAKVLPDLVEDVAAEGAKEGAEKELPETAVAA